MKLTSIVVFLLLLLTTLSASAAGLKVTEMAVTTKIVRGNPIDAVWRISSHSVKTLYCFTRLEKEGEGASTVKHRWYRGDEKVWESELPVKGEKWRTYSKRPIDKSSVGNWRVEAVDPSGKVLKVVQFKIN